MKLIRLFAAAVTGAAGEQRQLLREDLALQTAEDIAGRAFRRPGHGGRPGHGATSSG